MYGALKCSFGPCGPTANGTHTTPTDKSAIDVVCVYCPETNDCYYIGREGVSGDTKRVAPRPSDYRFYIATKGTSQRVMAD